MLASAPSSFLCCAAQHPTSMDTADSKSLHHYVIKKNGSPSEADCETSRFRAPGRGEGSSSLLGECTGYVFLHRLTATVSQCERLLRITGLTQTLGLRGISRNADRPCCLVWGLEDPGWTGPTTDFLSCQLMPQHHSKGQTEPIDISSKPSACLGLFSFAPSETRERMS